MRYELQLEYFQGPLEKLLELVHARELEVTKISLAKVTDDFLAYIRTLGEIPSSLLADFVVVASKLMLIKSKALLPEFPLTEEEEEEIYELEARLRLYQELKATEEHLHTLWGGNTHAVSRPYFVELAGQTGLFYPSKNLSPSTLENALGRLTKIFQRIVEEEEVAEARIVSLEDKMAEILERMNQMDEIHFKTFSGERPREELVALFLAILHLAREERVMLEQQRNFSDIIVKKRDAGQRK